MQTKQASSRRIPYYRWEQFAVYGNADGTFHVLVVDDSGGGVFADGFGDREQADWACALFNAAIGYRGDDVEDEATEPTQWTHAPRGRNASNDQDNDPPF